MVKKNSEIFDISLKDSVDVKEFFENILEFLPQHLYWKDKKGFILGCNDAQAKSAGFNSRKEIIGKTDFDMPWKEQANDLKKTDMEVIHKGTIKTIEEESVLADGTKATFLSKKVPLYYRDEIIGVLGISTDITEIKNTQKTLSENIQKLEQAYKDKLDFISMVSHEIRGPISNATVVLNLLSNSKPINDVLKIEEKKLLDMSLSELRHTLESVSYLIEIFKTEEKNKQLEYAEFDIEEFLNSISRGFNDYVKKPVFDINIPKELKKIESDMFLFKEIFIILIGNSIRFSKEIPHIKITAEYDKNRSNIVICLSDNGIGISPETLNNLNEEISFEDRNKQEKNYYNASIRLTHIKNILKLLGGNIKIESKKGEGTDIFVIIPIEKTSAELSEEKKYKDISPEKSKEKIKVLLVEDNDLTLEIEKRILIDSGVIVDTCCEGVTAIQMGKEGNYDIIFLDISLPDIDGIKVLKGIKPYVKESTFFVAVTSHVAEKDKENFLKNGFVAVMPKPLSRKNVIDILDGLDSYGD